MSPFAKAPTWLVIGGESLIGNALVKAGSESCRVIATSRRWDSASPLRLDLADDPAAWPELPVAEVAFITAAITHMDQCQDTPELARLINVTQTVRLVERLRRRGSHVVVLSSSAVFDGRRPAPPPDAPRHPANLYGRLKAELEDALVGQPGVAILRSTKVLSGRLPRIARWAESLLAAKPIAPLGSLGFSPIHVTHVVEALAVAGMQRLEGIWHVSGSSTISYYRFMQLLADALGVDRCLVQCSDEDVPAERLPIAHLGVGKWANISNMTSPDPKSVANLLSREILNSLPSSPAGRRSQPIEGTAPDPS